MIHEEICTYEVCKLAKEKGFREKCIVHYYDDTKDWYRSSNPQCYNFGGNTSDAPTQSLLQRWLREEKGVVFGISPMQEMDCDYLGWCATIYKVDENGYGLSWQEELYYNTYELALENALKYALENLI